MFPLSFSHAASMTPKHQSLRIAFHLNLFYSKLFLSSFVTEGPLQNHTPKLPFNQTDWDLGCDCEGEKFTSHDLNSTSDGFAWLLPLASGLLCEEFAHEPTVNSSLL